MTSPGRRTTVGLPSPIFYLEPVRHRLSTGDYMRRRSRMVPVRYRCWMRRLVRGREKFATETRNRSAAGEYPPRTRGCPRAFLVEGLSLRCLLRRRAAAGSEFPRSSSNDAAEIRFTIISRSSPNRPDQEGGDGDSSSSFREGKSTCGAYHYFREPQKPCACCHQPVQLLGAPSRNNLNTVRRARSKPVTKAAPFVKSALLDDLA